MTGGMDCVVPTIREMVKRHFGTRALCGSDAGPPLAGALIPALVLPEVAGLDVAPCDGGGPGGPEAEVEGDVAAREAGPPLAGALDPASDIG